jgi:hypothetical protein
VRCIGLAHGAPSRATLTKGATGMAMTMPRAWLAARNRALDHLASRHVCWSSQRASRDGAEVPPDICATIFWSTIVDLMTGGAERMTQSLS